MILTITSLELKTPFHFFVFANYARKNVGQLKRSKVVKFKSRGFWKTHYTMSLWNNEEEMRQYARSGAHLDSMKQSGKVAQTIRTLTIDRSEMPAWPEARTLLKAEGRVIQYG